MGRLKRDNFLLFDINDKMIIITLTLILKQ